MNDFISTPMTEMLFSANSQAIPELAYTQDTNLCRSIENGLETSNELNRSGDKEYPRVASNFSTAELKDCFHKNLEYSIPKAIKSVDEELTASEGLFNLKNETNEISWGYIGIQKSVGEERKEKDGRKEYIFKNIFSGVDLQYIPHENGVKENLILLNKDTPKEALIAYRLNGLAAVQVDDQTIELRNKENTTVFLITAPNMADASGASSEKYLLQYASKAMIK